MGICDTIWRAVDYYTDRDAMFTVAPRPGESKEQQRIADRLTQIGRALRELGIGWIAAYSASQRTRRAEFSDRSGPADQTASPGQGDRPAVASPGLVIALVDRANLPDALEKLRKLFAS